jgi:integrase/recombinase XerD
MLHIYRRHKKACVKKSCDEHRAKGWTYRRCQCPIWVDGTLNGEPIRKTLNERSWEAAQALVNSWERKNELPAEPEKSPAEISLASAWDSVIADLEAQGLSAQTVRKYKLLRRQMVEFGFARGLTLLPEFELDTIGQFRATWKDGARSAGKKLERLRSFYKFCLARKWANSNLASQIKSPKVSPCPTMPLSHEEMVKLLAACDALAATAEPSAKLNILRLKTLILVMRYTGLRVSDAVSLTTDRIDGKKLFLYTAKTGVPIYTILPDSVLRALEATPRVTETRYFWSGQGKRETAVCDWQGRIKGVFDLAGIVKGLSNAVSHRLRDTFAVELLLAGVPLDRVSILLGHQSIKITEKHYSPWTRSRQEQIESDLAAAWKLDPALSPTRVTPGLHGKSPVVN